MARHPDRQQLTAWLDGGSTEFDAHIDNCELCAAKLGEINKATGPATTTLKPALLTLLQPPDDLHVRVSARISQRLQQRRDAALFGSLLGVPFEAGRLVFDDDLDA